MLVHKILIYFEIRKSFPNSTLCMANDRELDCSFYCLTIEIINLNEWKNKKDKHWKYRTKAKLQYVQIYLDDYIIVIEIMLCKLYIIHIFDIFAIYPGFINTY